MQLISVAESALRRFQRAGAVAPAVPSPHRLLRAAGAARVERSISTTEIVSDDMVKVVAVKGVRIRITSGPFETMVSKRQLDPRDTARNAALAAAGRKYLGLWTRAGLAPLKGQDPTSIRSSAAPEGLLVPERAAEAWKAYRAASGVLDTAQRIAVDGIVLHDMAPAWVGRRVGAVHEHKLATTLGAHELRKGLETLALHFGLVTVPAPIPFDDDDDGSLPPALCALLAELDRREAATA